MKFHQYIRGGPYVSEIGFGAWQLGESSAWESMTESDATYLVHKALDMGINFFDTAPNYGLGTSEERLGKAFSKTARDKIVINTKFGHMDNGKLNFNSDNIRPSLEGSLRRLKTDYVDSLIIHNPPFKLLDGRNMDHYEILERLKDEGKIGAYGASLDTYEEMTELMSKTNSEVVEAFFNILHQDVRKAFKMAKDKGVSIIAKIPLDSGWLSGKYNENSVFEDIRKRWSKDDIKLRARLVDQLKYMIPNDNNISQVAISFCLAYDVVKTVIPGNKNVDQLMHNIKSADYSLSTELIESLEKYFNEKVEKLNLPW